MTLSVILLVTMRIASTTWANVVQKRLLAPDLYSPLQLFTIVWSWMTLLAIPWWLPTLMKVGPFWFWMGLTCALEVPGNVVLLRSLRSTELSIFGPLSSSKPAISLLLAFLLFAELPTWQGALGVVVVLIGSIVLTTEPRAAESNTSAAERRAGIRDRLLAVVLTATASVFLKQALDYGNQWEVLAAWCVLSWALAAVWLGVDRWWSGGRGKERTDAARRSDILRRGASSYIRRDASSYILRSASIHNFMVAVAMLVMQGCTIALFSLMPVGYALALFQMGSIVSVLVGHRWLGEAHLARRLIASIIMVTGAVVIILGR